MFGPGILIWASGRSTHGTKCRRRLTWGDPAFFPHPVTVWIADFKVAAHLGAILVMFALHRFLIQPDTWSAHVDIGQAINCLLYTSDAADE